MPDVTTIDRLIQAYAGRPQGFMWFLGAGASRTAGMPTASDIIWDLKFRQYCLVEDQNVRTQDASNHALRNRVQQYFESKGAPSAFDPKEYSFYFELAFGADYAAQQKYLEAALSPDKIALKIGHRAFGAMLAMGRARVVFTTNFDNVVETAIAQVAAQHIIAFHLEGSYAALDALNAERFPLYAKLHGDFRYRKLKNLTDDLQANDEQIQKCLLAAANRFGIVITGYSGRDDNIMSMLRVALKQPNAFPNGLYWTIPRRADVTPRVSMFIEEAIAIGINAHLVEIGTFDVFMSRLWRQLPEVDETLDDKICSKHATKVSIPLPPIGKSFPVLRTNALPVTSLPNRCGRLVYGRAVTLDELRDGQAGSIPDAVYALESGLLFWGAKSEVEKWTPSTDIKEATVRDFDDPFRAIAESTVLRSFFEHALAKAVCAGRPVVLRRKGRALFAVATTDKDKAKQLEPLARAIAYSGTAPTSGVIPKIDVRWAEAVSIHLEARNGAAYLLLEPETWITPLSKREDASEFMKARVLKRYNSQAYRILDAWIQILLGNVPSGQDANVTAFADTEQSAAFQISSRTAYSGKSGLDA